MTAPPTDLWLRFRARLTREGLTVTEWAAAHQWSRTHVWMAVNRPEADRGAQVLPAIRAYLNGRGS